jgi:hypothetical protein
VSGAGTSLRTVNNGLGWDGTAGRCSLRSALASPRTFGSDFGLSGAGGTSLLHVLASLSGTSIAPTLGSGFDLEEMVNHAAVL